MRAVADQVLGIESIPISKKYFMPMGEFYLHNDIRAVRFERYAIITIVDVGVLNGDTRRTVRIPSVFIILAQPHKTRNRVQDRLEGSEKIPVFFAVFLLVLFPAISMLS